MLYYQSFVATGEVCRASYVLFALWIYARATGQQLENGNQSCVNADGAYSCQGFEHFTTSSISVTATVRHTWHFATTRTIVTANCTTHLTLYTTTPTSVTSAIVQNHVAIFILFDLHWLYLLNWSYDLLT